MPLPTIPPELVAALDKLIPHRCPTTNTPERDIWFYAGKRDLVDFLKAEAELQATDITRSAVPSSK